MATLFNSKLVPHVKSQRFPFFLFLIQNHTCCGILAQVAFMATRSMCMCSCSMVAQSSSSQPRKMRCAERCLPLYISQNSFFFPVLLFFEKRRLLHRTEWIGVNIHWLTKKLGTYWNAQVSGSAKIKWVQMPLSRCLRLQTHFSLAVGAPASGWLLNY